MRVMPPSVYRYIFRYSKWQQVVVIILTLMLLPLAPVPLELQRCLLDDAVANSDVDLLIWLAMLYIGALLLSSSLKLAMRIQRELISARIVHALTRSVYYHIYTVTPPSLLEKSAQGGDVVDEGGINAVVRGGKAGRFCGCCDIGAVAANWDVICCLGLYVLY